MNKPVFVFDLNRVLPEEQVEELRAKLAAQIESGVLLLGDEVTFVEAFSADEAAPVVAFEGETEETPAEWATPGAYKLTSRRSAAVGDKELKEAVQEVLKTLSEREALVLTLRFGLDDGIQRTLEEVGQSLGVTRERVRQSEAKAIRKINHPSRGKLLRAFTDND